jgi:type IV conjugative transfer system coupling protein TraD
MTTQQETIETTLKNVTRGGQILLHNLRMIGQVVKKVLLWLLPVGCLASVLWFFWTTEPYTRYLGEQWLWAKCALFLGNAHHTQAFLFPDGHVMAVFPQSLINSPVIQETIGHVKEKGWQALDVGFFVYALSVILTLLWLQRRGDRQTANKPVRGDKLGSVSEVRKILKRNHRNSAFTLGLEQLPLPRFSEQQHFLFHGTTGSGKSTAIKELLEHIRRRGERAIVYDKSCNLVKEFYCPERDQLMNPLDSRGVDWSLWRECRDKADFESLAAAQIPMPPSTQDPFWINAARTIFAAAAYRMRTEKNPKIVPLLRYLLTADIEELQNLLRGTEAETLMSEKTEKTAISIKSVLATYLKSLCYIKDGDNPFSIRQWVQDDTAKDWLFISSLGDKHESLKPLITAWLDIAVNALLSLPEKPSRRIWIILDEIASLHRLPYLTAGLSEARKFGGCFVVGLLSIAQLAEVYGQEGAKALSALLNTRLMFRQPDPDVAHWSARNLGKTIIEEVQEGISYGANTLRDGVSLNRVEREKPVVIDSEIMALPDLTCYVRLPGQYPITQLHIPYVARPEKNTPFVARDFEQDNLRQEVMQLTEELAVPVTEQTSSPLKKPHSMTMMKNTEKEETSSIDVFR